MNCCNHNDNLFFRPASVSRAGNTETVLELVFNNTAPSESIPEPTEVADVLRRAPVDNSTDSVEFDTSSIVVESMFFNFNKNLSHISYHKRN